jgi:hypothetical protein
MARDSQPYTPAELREMLREDQRGVSEWRRNAAVSVARLLVEHRHDILTHLQNWPEVLKLAEVLADFAAADAKDSIFSALQSSFAIADMRAERGAK